MRKPSFFAELKRRNVYRAAVFYAAGAWLVAQVAGLVLPAFHAQDWVLRWIIIALAVGFPFWLLFAWFYELTPEGIRRESEIATHESIAPETGRRMDRWIFAIMGLAIVLLITDRFVLEHETAVETSAAPAAAAPIPTIETDPSIAVLPLVNMSDDKANEYFSDGISEELLNLLAKVPKLRVIARTSSFSFKGKDTPISQIARELQVASVLEGSVRKSGDTVRITAQLIRASDGSHLWSETYDRTLVDIFKVQDEIAAAVVEQLKIKLLGAAPTAKPVDAKAYPLILQAEALAEQQSAASRAQAAALFQQALVVAPNEARTWAGLARVHANQVFFSDRPAPEGARLAKQTADRALALDPDNAVAMAVLGRIAADLDLDLPAAARYHQRALQVEPGNYVAINAAGLLLLNIGRLDEAIALLEYRVARDPANPTAFYNLGAALYAARRWDQAIEALRTVLRLSPGFGTTHYQIGVALLVGKRDAAAALKECEAEPDDRTRQVCLALALPALHPGQDADAALQSLIGKYGKDHPAMLASVQAYLGQPDAAFETLAGAVAIRDPLLTGAPMEPLFDSLHGDPRWLPFLRQFGYAPEQLAEVELDITLLQ